MFLRDHVTLPPVRRLRVQAPGYMGSVGLGVRRRGTHPGANVKGGSLSVPRPHPRGHPPFLNRRPGQMPWTASRGPRPECHHSSYPRGGVANLLGPPSSHPCSCLCTTPESLVTEGGQPVHLACWAEVWSALQPLTAQHRGGQSECSCGSGVTLQHGHCWG